MARAQETARVAYLVLTASLGALFIGAGLLGLAIAFSQLTGIAMIPEPPPSRDTAAAQATLRASLIFVALGLPGGFGALAVLVPNLPGRRWLLVITAPGTIGTAILAVLIFLGRWTFV